MVINDFDVESIAVGPVEADSPLVVNADAPLSGTISVERFVAIAGGSPQKIQGGRGMQLRQFPLRDSAYGQPAARATPAEQGARIPVAY
jgi:hypothetical protein